MRKYFFLSASLVGFGVSQAVEVGEKPPTPQIPGTDYVVHDGTRPQPRVVETGGAGSVKAPSDAKVLFGGENTDAWEGNWTVKDGILIASKGNFQTKDSFGPMQLHIEWRIPEGRKVNGQTGGNSGIFIMGRYEVQVLQSHTNKTYPDGQAGSLYGQYPPLVNATAPQGEWQSYDITFTPPVYKDGKFAEPATVTVIHNGVVVQNAQKFMGPTQHKKLATYPATHPETGPLKLQWHGDPIEYRNIWVRPPGEYDQAE